MWFISFVMGVATALSVGVYCLSAYMEYAKAAAAGVRQREWLASMPMPPPRPPVPAPKPVRIDNEIETVRVPTPGKATYKAWQNSRYGKARYSRHRSAKPKYAKPRYPHETW
jgi:hypothetical protein